MHSVRCVDLHKIYKQGDQDVIGLDGVSLEVEREGFVCLRSPSGAGKTTLLNAMGGLDRPDSGEVHVAGKRIDNLSKGRLADMRLRNIGFVFQAYNLIPVLTAIENVEFVMHLQGVPAAERARRAGDVLNEVGLGGLENRRPAKMSGGQQQRVAVARAIVSRPAIVLADEPTANLDSSSARHLMELFAEINKTRGTTFVIATHDEMVMSYSKRLIRMRDGRIVEDLLQDV